MTDFDREAWARALERRRTEKAETFRSAAETPLSEEALAAFDGLSWFPPDESFVRSGRLEPSDGTTVDLDATRGPPMAYDLVGQLGVEVDGSLTVLDVYQAPGVTALLIPFRDATNGTETWVNGRYLTIANPWEKTDRRPTTVTIDFNDAYHPLCVYDASVRSAIPPAANSLDVAVRAGERLPDE
jgi:uncharacterized protein (DUF1684 family)